MITIINKKNVAAFSVTLMLLIGVSLTPNQLFAQEEMDDKFGLTVTLNSDQFFGFYPFFAGSYAVSDNLDFTFYGILWSGGTGGGWGNWTEFGVGVSFPAGDAFTVTPQLGFTSGNLLSSGASGPAIVGDGIVPNLTVGLDTEKLSGELYAGFYAPFRDEAPLGGTTLSFLHYWLLLGYKTSSFFTLGAHYEHLINTGGSEVEESTDTYQWLGPYVQFNQPSGGVFARFSFGTDLLDDNDSFYKLTVGYSF